MINAANKWIGVSAFAAAVAVGLYNIYLHRHRTAHAGSLLRRTTLTPQTISAIRATAPIVSRHVSEIVNRFYDIFFTRHPEMRSLFSLSHGGQIEEADRDTAARALAVCPVRKSNTRKNVTGMQARAMAHTICAYAARLADSDQSGFDEVVHKIANKHVSHHVTPEMYPLLGSCLLEAMFSVLDNSVANADVVNAWTDAYWYLAETLMMEEDEIIERAMAPGNNGWIGFRSFEVRKQIESESIISIYLTPDDGIFPLPLFQPGQYVTLKIILPNGSVTHRNYSLSDCPGHKYFRISVKRVVGGEVSNYIHDILRSGDKLLVSVPCGTFTLSKYFLTLRKNQIKFKKEDYKMPLVFISAGIGNTPFMSMLNSICDPKTPNLVTSKEVAVSGESSTGVKGSDLSNSSTVESVQEAVSYSGQMLTSDVLNASALLKGTIPIIYIHAAKNKRHDSFFSHAQTLGDRRSRCRVITVYSQPRAVVDVPGKDFLISGHVDEPLLKASIADPANTVFYICGPDHFTRAQYNSILAIGGQSDHIFYERFAPGGFSNQLSSKLSF